MYSLFSFIKKSPLLFTQCSRQFAQYTRNGLYHSVYLHQSLHYLSFSLHNEWTSDLKSLSLFDCSSSVERHCTTVNRTLNLDSGLNSSFCPRCLYCIISIFLPPQGKQDIHKTWFCTSFCLGFRLGVEGKLVLGDLICFFCFRRDNLLFWFCIVPDRVRELVEAYRHQGLISFLFPILSIDYFY